MIHAARLVHEETDLLQREAAEEQAREREAHQYAAPLPQREGGLHARGHLFRRLEVPLVPSLLPLLLGEHCEHAELDQAREEGVQRRHVRQVEVGWADLRVAGGHEDAQAGRGDVRRPLLPHRVRVAQAEHGHLDEGDQQQQKHAVPRPSVPVQVVLERLKRGRGDRVLGNKNAAVRVVDAPRNAFQRHQLRRVVLGVNVHHLRPLAPLAVVRVD
mmetsp:Transcript_17055/g.42306  ORF Transcript_17055/g.42306 Transcript_17055/m.42306 type:complete len:215 (-) Transcript_17055:882-1526(-)